MNELPLRRKGELIYKSKVFGGYGERNVGRMRKDEGALPEQGAGTKVIMIKINNNHYHLFHINKAIMLPKHLMSQN